MKMPLTIEQKGKLVEIYFETKSIVQTQRQHRRHFAVTKAPERKTIWRIVKKLQTEKTVHYANKGRSDRTRGARTQQNIEAVCLSASQGTKKPCQQRSQELGLSRMSTVCKLKLDLKLFTFSSKTKIDCTR